MVQYVQNYNLCEEIDIQRKLRLALIRETATRAAHEHWMIKKKHFVYEHN